MPEYRWLFGGGSITSVCFDLTRASWIPECACVTCKSVKRFFFSSFFFSSRSLSLSARTLSFWVDVLVNTEQVQTFVHLNRTSYLIIIINHKSPGLCDPDPWPSWRGDWHMLLTNNEIIIRWWRVSSMFSFLQLSISTPTEILFVIIFSRLFRDDPGPVQTEWKTTEHLKPNLNTNLRKWTPNTNTSENRIDHICNYTERFIATSDHQRAVAIYIKTLNADGFYTNIVVTVNN